MEFLVEDEFTAMINTCKTDSEQGRRDILLLYNIGVRVSEPVGLKLRDIHNDGQNTTTYIRVHGKSHKERHVPIRWRLDAFRRPLSLELLAKKKITPHTFRHTTALRMLQADVDVSTIAIWPGCESIITTHKYMEVELAMKRQTLEKVGDPCNSACNFIRQRASTLVL